MPEFTIDYTGPFRENAERILRPVAGQRLQYLEIGVLEGRSAVWMLENILTNSHAHYTGIDAYVMGKAKRAACIQRAKQNLAPHKRKCRFLIGRSELLLPQLLAEQRSYDVIYIDGDHSMLGAAIDVAYAWKLLKPGGVLAIDDMRHPKYKPMRRVVKAMVRELPGEVLADNDQLWVRKKTKWV